MPIRQPRRTHVAVKLTQAPGPHHVATTPKRRRLRCLVSCQGMKPNWRPCRPLLTDPHPPPRDSPPAGPANWASALALRHVPRSPLAPGGVAPCSPSDGIWDVKSSVRGKSDKDTEGNLSTFLTFLSPLKWCRGPCPPEGKGHWATSTILPPSPHPQGPRKSGGDQSSQGPCARQGTVVLL